MPKVSVVDMEGPDKPSETMTVDIDESMAKKLKVGQKIKLMVMGTVGMVALPYPGGPTTGPSPDGEGEKEPSRLGIEVTEKKVSLMGEQEAGIDAMVNDEDADGE